MDRILVVADDAPMRRAIAASLSGIGHPVVAARDRGDARPALDGAGQVMVYSPGWRDDVGWAAEMLERHPELRVVYLSPGPWASLDYRRARCIIAPHSPGALDADLLRRMVRALVA